MTLEERSRDNVVIEGLEYILLHFRHQMQLWPRTISTKTTDGKQIVAYSKKEAFARFRQANFMDCRISAYPYWRSSITSEFAEIKNTIEAYFIMIDLDICNFDYDDVEILRVLRQTLMRVKESLADYRPTVIWSGNGYHIYIPIEAPVLENIKEFAHIDQISAKFIRFAEWYLSNGKSDHVHNSTVSLNNCLLRVPGSINSKNNVMVKIIKKFDSLITPPNISLIMGSFCAYLADQEIKENRYRKSVEQQITIPTTKNTDKYRDNNNKEGIYWIEKLLQTPLPDYRKTCIWKILAPYLINTKRLSYDQSFIIIENWLNSCSKLCRLKFSPRPKIKEDLNTAIKKKYFPIGLSKLHHADKDLYNFLQSYGVIDYRKQ